MPIEIIKYEDPDKRTYIFCDQKEYRVAVELCDNCPYLKGCSNFGKYVAKQLAPKNEASNEAE